MDLSSFHYDLPEELIAQAPLAERDGARMLVIDRQSGTWADRKFRDLPGYLRPTDCLVLNESKVFPSRLLGHRPGRTGRIEVFLVEPVSAEDRRWRALVRPGKKLPVGERILFGPDFEATVLDREEHGQRILELHAADVWEAIQKHGHVPLPPYIDRADEAEDRERYQTIYARERGSVAAPTAGLHFTPRVLAEISANVARVTLHVGLGTFQPLHSSTVEENRLHKERFFVSDEARAAINAAQRVVAAGTTSVRTLESVDEKQGETDIFIYPGYTFKRVGAMLTNFHLPQSSLLLLVCAFGGTELMLEAYRHAVRERYRFFSYGDCMLIL
ncbi:MAG: tRNA preQ1(34) S-adenosylmethionine ribosyltransferase-isomerase QueA [Acidobacteria bacterium]|nr:tRNA preQ1(34) S-adenosylmethionine ribosyltransferase-isomerase QueA [Acidobacteriota bacterium]